MPKFRIATLFMAFALSACGGGGGSSSPPPPPPPPPPPLSVSVTVNGVAVTPAGAIPVAPGQTVQLTSNKSVTWTPTAANVILRSTSAAASAWSSQVINPAAQAAAWSVTAAAGSETTTINFSLSGGDARNGDYVMFATNSQRYVLSVNFDVNEYSIVTSSGTAGQPVASGTFSVDAGTTNHVFNVTPPAGQANTAKFRAKASADAIVGAYPLPGTTQPVAFIAARKFATSAADFPTNVDLQFFGAEGSGTPQLVQSSLFTGRFNGAVYTTCIGLQIALVDNCPAGNLAVYDLTFNANGSIRAIARAPGRRRDRDMGTGWSDARRSDCDGNRALRSAHNSVRSCGESGPWLLPAGLVHLHARRGGQAVLRRPVERVGDHQRRAQPGATHCERLRRRRPALESQTDVSLRLTSP